MIYDAYVAEPGPSGNPCRYPHPPPRRRGFTGWKRSATLATEQRSWPSRGELKSAAAVQKVKKPCEYRLNALAGRLKRWATCGLQWRLSVSRVTLAIAATLSSIFFALPAFAAEKMPTPSFPKPWQLGFQNPVTPVAEQMMDLHNFLLWIITAITLFVLALILICIFRFNERANPVPAKWSHNTLLEVIWTAVPVLILVVIAIPSYRLLYYMDRVEEADMTIKVIGNQWFWSYELPDYDISFDSLALPDDQIDVAAGQYRQLETDTHVVLPVDTTIRILFTSNDVIHAWAVPAFGVKLDNTPGRINETWTRVTQEGRYYGQCSELCGVEHSLMPIVVDVVSKEKFQQYVERQQAGIAPASNTQVAVAR